MEAKLEVKSLFEQQIPEEWDAQDSYKHCYNFLIPGIEANWTSFSPWIHSKISRCPQQ